MDVYNEIIQWLEEHKGKMPRGVIKEEGKNLKVSEMTEKQKYERNLYHRFRKSIEKKILDEYEGRPIEEVPEENREKVENLRRYGLGVKEKRIYDEIIQWLKENEGKKLRGVIIRKGKILKTEEMTEEEQYERNLYHRFRKSIEKKILDEYEGIPIEEVPEENREMIATLRKYGLGIEEKGIYEQMIQWLEENEGKKPRGAIVKKGKIIKSKEMTEAERYERNLYLRFYNSPEKRILDEYAGRPIEEVPVEYRKKIENLRKYGLETKEQVEKNTYEEIVQWLEEHKGKMPRTTNSKEGKILKIKEMTWNEKYERNLYLKFNRSLEKKILDEYAGRPIEEVPEEYREKIATLRKYGLGLTTYEEIIKWIEEHNGKKPKGSIAKDGEYLNVKEMAEDKKYEVNLYRRFNNSLEKKILEEYKGRPIEEVPEEYREKIATLRKYGLGLTIYEETIKWLEEHNGKKPRGAITKDGEFIKIKEMTEEENYEVNLYRRFNNSLEKKILDEYRGRLIEEVPEEYRESIEKLRKYGFGNEEKSTYKEMIQWLEEHNGKKPRGAITMNGVFLKRKEMTEEENYEVNLYQRFNKSSEKKILDEYAGRPIEEVPEEYREKISTLRKFEQLGKEKDKKIENRMKKSVAKQVKNNQETRKKLESLEYQRNNKNINDSNEEIEI